MNERQKPTTLADVLETHLLSSRVASLAKRRRSIILTASFELSQRSDPILHSILVERAKNFCEAQSAGISIFSRVDRGESKWVVAQGHLSEYEGRRFPLRHSLCGVTAELGATQLFVKPQRYFKWIEQAGVFISEALVTPLMDPDGRCFGTIWVMSHRGSRTRFDSDDASLLENYGAMAQLELWSRRAVEPKLF